MFIVRALFWFAVVAILMPRGPDLGLDFHRLRAELPAQSVPVYPDHAMASLRAQVAAARIRAEDPVRIWRDDMLNQLSRVRMELVQANSPAVGRAPVAAAGNPLF